MRPDSSLLSNTNTSTDTSIDTGTETDTNTNTNTNTITNVNSTNTHTNTNYDSNANTNTNANIDTNIDTNTTCVLIQAYLGNNRCLRKQNYRCCIGLYRANPIMLLTYLVRAAVLIYFLMGPHRAPSQTLMNL